MVFASVGDFRLNTYCPEHELYPQVPSFSKCSLLIVALNIFLHRLASNWVISLGRSNAFYSEVIYTWTCTTCIPSPVHAEEKQIRIITSFSKFPHRFKDHHWFSVTGYLMNLQEKHIKKSSLCFQSETKGSLKQLFTLDTLPLHLF